MSKGSRGAVTATLHFPEVASSRKSEPLCVSIALSEGVIAAMELAVRPPPPVCHASVLLGDTETENCSNAHGEEELPWPDSSNAPFKPLV